MGGPVGLNWYLTRPEDLDHPDNSNGEKRHHLTQPVWSACDADLVSSMAAFSDPGNRVLSRFEASGVLPADTLYGSEMVPVNARDRSLWHQRALDRLAPCRAVFLDPDNGFEIKSMTSKTSPKYAFHQEVHLYRARGQVVVTIQFAPRRSVPEIARNMLTRHHAVFPEDRPLALLRGRSSPNIYLQIAAPPKNQRPVLAALGHLVARLPGKLEWVSS